MSAGKLSSRMTTIAWIANASFSSISPRSSTSRPARRRALRVAGTGPRPIVRGSTPAAAEDTIRTSGRRPSSRALRSLVIRTAAAPSAMPLEFPAVTLPPSRQPRGRFPGRHVPEPAIEALRDRVRCAAHALDASGDEDVAFAGLDRPRGGVDRGEPGGTQAIEGHRGDGAREACQEGGHPGDISVVLPRLVRATEVDLFHDRRIEARAAHDLPDDERRQVIGPHVLQVAVMTPHRGPDGSHNYRFRHSASPNAGHHPVVGFGLRGRSLPDRSKQFAPLPPKARSPRRLSLYLEV